MNRENQLGIAPLALIATIGPIVTKSKAILTKIAPVLQKVFSSKATRELKAQKGEYDAANTQLRTDIGQLNSAISELQSQGNNISAQMKQAGINGLAGFGDLGGIFSNIIDRITGKTKATKQLNTAKATYEALSKERDQKLTAANEMVQQIDALQKRLQSSVQSSGQSVVPGVSNGVLIGGVALAAVATVLIINSNSKPKKK